MHLLTCPALIAILFLVGQLESLATGVTFKRHALLLSLVTPPMAFFIDHVRHTAEAKESRLVGWESGEDLLARRLLPDHAHLLRELCRDHLFARDTELPRAGLLAVVV